MRRPRSHPVPVSAHVSSALKDLGVLPQRVTTAVESAWAQAADELQQALRSFAAKV